MGYHTDFKGSFEFNKELSPKMLDYLTKFNETRRMKRKTDEVFGKDGEFYVFGSGFMGQGHDENVIDHNTPPATQPGLWCQWTPTSDGMELEWDGGEKFYYYEEWLFYLINKIIAPNGYVLNGTVEWSGEEVGDNGVIEVENNHIRVNGVLMQEVVKSEMDYSTWERSTVKNYMDLDNVLILDNIEKLIPQTATPAEEVPPTKEEVEAAGIAVKEGLITQDDYREVVNNFLKSLVD